MAEDLGEKTEQPSARKRDDARSRGQIAKSVELGAVIDLSGALVLLVFFGPGMVDDLAALVRLTLADEAPGGGLRVDNVDQLAVWTALHAAKVAAPFMAVMVLVVYAAQLVQVGFLITGQPLKPSLDRINPISGAGRLLSRKNLVKALLSVVKLGLVSAVVGGVLARRFPEMAALPNVPMLAGWRYLGELLVELAAWMLLLMLLLAVLDWMYQRWQLTQDLKMTKQEVKDERRSMEGDAETKGRRLRIGRQMVMQRLRMDVPRADVVVTNPTHFSVALRYDAETMDAPRVVAKGADYLAFRIREIAAASGVPIVEKPALARALYAGVPVGRAVRPEFYEAVAEVLAYVYRLEQQAA